MKTVPPVTEAVMGAHNKRLKPTPTYEKETDPAILSRRQKQLDYGKTTPEYHNYIAAVPRVNREPFHPRTPNKNKKYSRRAWDGLVRQWRMNLHVWSENPISAASELESMAGDDLNESFASGGTEESSSTSSSLDTAFSLGFPNFPKSSDKDSSSSKGMMMKVENEDEISDEESDGENEESMDTMNKTLTEESCNNDKAKQQQQPSLSTSWGDEVNEYLDECEKNYIADDGNQF